MQELYTALASRRRSCYNTGTNHKVIFDCSSISYGSEAGSFLSSAPAVPRYGRDLRALGNRNATAIGCLCSDYALHIQLLHFSEAMQYPFGVPEWAEHVWESVQLCQDNANRIGHNRTGYEL